MSNLRRFEAACGRLAAFFGILTFASSLFGLPNSSGQSGTVSVFQVSLQPITLVVFCIFLLGLIGAATSSVRHNRTGGNGWRLLLWVSAVVIVAFTTIVAFTAPAMLGVDIFLLISTLFALFTCALSLGVRRVTLS